VSYFFSHKNRDVSYNQVNKWKQFFAKPLKLSLAKLKKFKRGPSTRFPKKQDEEKEGQNFSSSRKSRRETTEVENKALSL